MTSFSLASGHENPQKDPATAMPDALFLTLRYIPLVAELEAMIAAGKGWSKEFDQRAEEISIELFSITRADTEPKCPQPEAFYIGRSQKLDQRAYDAAVEEWWKHTEELWVPSPQEANDDQILDWWEDRGIDVSDEDGYPLRCLVNIDRQMNAAARLLIPGASFRPGGGGKRGPSSAEAWGSNLAEDAARFMKGR